MTPSEFSDTDLIRPVDLEPGDAEVIAAVRRRAVHWGVLTVIVMGLAVWALGTGVGTSVGMAVLVGALWRLVQVWRNPLDHRHTVEPNPVRRVLDAGGLPPADDGRGRTPAEIRLAVEELTDRIRWEPEGFWATRVGRALVGTGGLLGVALWGVLGVLSLIWWGDLASVGICVCAAGLFLVVDRLGRRQEADRARALDLLGRELTRLEEVVSAEPRPESPLPVP